MSKISKNLLHLFFSQVETYRDKAFCFDYKESEWVGTSFLSMEKKVLSFAYALRQKGVQKGDRVIILSESRNEWLISDLAIMSIGAISVPVYTTNTTKDHAYIIGNSGAKCAIVSNAKLAKPFLPAAFQMGLSQIFTIEEINDISHQSITVESWNESISHTDAQDLQAIKKEAAEIDPEHTSCIIYTSGTSGNPTGVMLSHRSILANIIGSLEVIETFGDPIDGHKLISFLPLSHAYEHTTGFFLLLACGGQIYFNPSLDKLLNALGEVKPSFMTCVPRLLEMIRGRVMSKARQQGGLKEKFLNETIRLGTKAYENPESLTLVEKLKNRALDKLVRHKIGEIFGGNIRVFCSGGAPLNYEVGLFFTALGFNVLQGFGQTEASPLISINPYHDNRIKSVGKPLGKTEVKIAEDGEILVRGDLLMSGYWNNAEKTAKTIQDGWLYTGDTGHIDEDGYIYITDRKKDIIINTGGDSISPQKVEGLLCLEEDIDQCMVYGDRKDHLVALVIPNQELLKAYNGNINDANLKQIVKAAVGNANKSLSVIERVRNFIITNEPFSIENGLLTNTLKIRRVYIVKKYKEQLEGLY